MHDDLWSELEQSLLLWLLLELREWRCCSLVQSLLRWLRVLLSDKGVGGCVCGWAGGRSRDYSGCGPSRWLNQRRSSETSAWCTRLLLQSSRRSQMRRLDLLSISCSTCCQRRRQTASMQDRLRLLWRSRCRISKLSGSSNLSRCLRLLRRCRCISLVMLLMPRHHQD